MKGKELGWAVVLCVAASIASPVYADAAATKRDPAQEAALDAALRAISPPSVETFHVANDAMDRRDYVSAASAYAKVHAAAPAFVAATRRLCTAEARSGKPEAAVGHCREALAAEPSAENHAALAVTLLQSAAMNPGALEEAKKEAGEAAKLAPGAEFVEVTLCQVAYEAADVELMDRCSGKLAALDPDAATTHYFAAAARFGHHDFAAARAELEKAKAAGIDPALYTALHGQIELGEHMATPTPIERITRSVELLLGGWAAGLVLLLGAGVALGSERSRRAALLRRLYGALVTAATLYFYATLAVLVVATTAVVGAFAYGTYPMGQSTFIKVVVVSSVLVYAALAIARAATSYDDEDPLGVPVNLDEEPKLRALLGEVAKAIGTRPVDAVYVAPGTQIEISDRGGALAHLRGRSERALVLGADWVGDKKLRLLRERLAREYARWRREGGAGGSLALAMRRALRLGLEENQSGLNPARWLLHGWSAVYERISRGAVAEQEELGKRWVEQAYGAKAAAREDDGEPGSSLLADRAALDERLRKKKPVAIGRRKARELAREED